MVNSASPQSDIVSLDVFEPPQLVCATLLPFCSVTPTSVLPSFTNFLSLIKENLLVAYTIDDRNSTLFAKRVPYGKLTLQVFKEKVFARKGSYRYPCSIDVCVIDTID